MQRVLDGWLFWQCFIEGKPLCTHPSPADKAIEDGQASGIGPLMSIGDTYGDSTVGDAGGIV